MPFQGTLVNAVAVVAGSVAGLVLRKWISESLRELVLCALGLAALLIGADLALKTEHLPLCIGSLVVGGVVGHLLGLEKLLEALGEWLRGLVARAPGLAGLLSAGSPGGEARRFSVGEAFVTASLVFCVGPLTIMGSLQDGAQGDASLLFTKSALDGPCSMALAAGMGFGVVFAALSVLAVQGSLTLVGLLFHQFLTDAILTEVLAVGGLMTVAIGLELLRIKKLPVANFLPAMFFAGVGAWLVHLL